MVSGVGYNHIISMVWDISDGVCQVLDKKPLDSGLGYFGNGVSCVIVVK